MATDSYSARLTELARVISHLCNMQRLRAEAQRLRQRRETLDALDSVIALDTARAEELNVLLEQPAPAAAQQHAPNRAVQSAQ